MRIPPMFRRITVVVSATIFAFAPVATAPPSGADPIEDPCQLAFSLFCRLMPFAPGLDHNLDLTQNQPPPDPAAPPPESLPLADPCAAGCV